MDPLFDEIAARAPARLAVADLGGAWSFAELSAQAHRVAEALRHRPRLLLALPGGRELSAVVLGALAARAPFMPIPADSTAAEAARFVAAWRPDLALVAPGARLLGGLPPQVQVRGFDAIDAIGDGADEPYAMVQPTSGSTAAPKAIAIARAALEANIENNASFNARFAERAALVVMPSAHAMGFAALFELLLAGASVHLSERFVPGEDLARIAAHGISVLASSPSYFRMLHRLGARPAIEDAILGSAAADPALIGALVAGGMRRVHLRYGLSESVGALCRLELSGPEWSAGEVGPPVPGIELSVGEEVRARGPANALGVLTGDRLDPLHDADGWLPTGDVGRLDARGHLHLEGRASAFIKRGGHRVSPEEIEAALREDPGVADAGVVGVPDAVDGQAIVAFVEVEAARVPALLAHLAQVLAPHKRPRRLIAVPRLPRLPSGKLDRRTLAEWAR